MRYSYSVLCCTLLVILAVSCQTFNDKGIYHTIGTQSENVLIIDRDSYACYKREEMSNYTFYSVGQIVKNEAGFLEYNSSILDCPEELQFNMTYNFELKENEIRIIFDIDTAWSYWMRRAVIFSDSTSTIINLDKQDSIILSSNIENGYLHIVLLDFIFAQSPITRLTRNYNEVKVEYKPKSRFIMYNILPYSLAVSNWHKMEEIVFPAVRIRKRTDHVLSLPRSNYRKLFFYRRRKWDEELQHYNGLRHKKEVQLKPVEGD